jgi:hypothetical protein
MKRIVLLLTALSYSAMADLLVFDLTAGFGQGVTHGSGNDFRQQGIQGPHASTLTVSGAASNNGTSSFSGVPTGSADGFRITFDSRGISPAFTLGPPNTWNFNGGGGTSFALFGRFASAGIATPSLLFSGTVISGPILTQTAGGTGVITQTTPMLVNLSNITSAGLALLTHFTPGNYKITNASLTGLTFTPNSAVGASGGFTSTAGNFGGGTFSFTAAAPEPATYMSFALAGVALVALRRFKKQP